MVEKCQLFLQIMLIQTEITIPKMKIIRTKCFLLLYKICLLQSSVNVIKIFCISDYSCMALKKGYFYKFRNKFLTRLL